MEDDEKVESFREQIEQRLETLETAVADLKSVMETMKGGS